MSSYVEMQTLINTRRLAELEGASPNNFNNTAQIEASQIISEEIVNVSHTISSENSPQS